MMPFGQFNSVLISVSENYPLTKVITYQFIRIFPGLQGAMLSVIDFSPGNW